LFVSPLASLKDSERVSSFTGVVATSVLLVVVVVFIFVAGIVAAGISVIFCFDLQELNDRLKITVNSMKGNNFFIIVYLIIYNTKMLKKKQLSNN